MARHIFDSLMHEWGTSKVLQIVLMAAAAACITIVIGANVIKNQPINKKEIEIL